jgi:SWI/SNF-related matrix-associated actin-dependent regulator 1 of chromatin subfamily A
MIRNPKALRTRSIKYLAKNIPHIICITGTPVINRPIEFFTTLNMLDPVQFPNYFKYAQEFCSPSHNGFGWQYKGASNTEKLHELLTRSFMIRRLKKDVLTQLPPKTRTIIPMEINNRVEYNEARDDLIQYLSRTEGSDAAEKASMAETLVKFSKLKQLSIKGKLDLCIEWIENFIQEQKLVVFCVHHNTIDALIEKFEDIAVKLDGRDSQNQRQKAIDSFQNDENIKLFIGNIKAAGVGITLTAASSAAFLELPWTPGECSQAEDRIHRIGQESSHVDIYYLAGFNTIDEEMAEIIDNKKKTIDAIMDGIDTEEKDLISELIEKYKQEKAT